MLRLRLDPLLTMAARREAEKGEMKAADKPRYQLKKRTVETIWQRNQD
jgi:hypothetical protein